MEAIFQIVCVLLSSSLILQGHAASLYNPKDSYDTSNFEDDIRDNLIDDEPTIDLLPPLENAKDYFSNTPPKNVYLKSPYVIDPVDKVIRLKEDENTTEEPQDDESLDNSYVESFDSFLRKMNENEDEHGDEDTPSAARETILKLLEAYLETTANESSPKVEVKIQLPESNTELPGTTEETSTEGGEEDDDSSEDETERENSNNFLAIHPWSFLKTSIEYLGSLFRDLISSKEFSEESTEETTDDYPYTTVEPLFEVSKEDEPQSQKDKESKAPNTPLTMFALEEPSKAHLRLPSQESDKRSRDIDALLYGQGII